MAQEEDKQETSAEVTEFVSVLEELADYKKYFENEDNYKTLVDWLHEDTGISKLVLRKTLKHIAPLVISAIAKKAEDSAKGLYSAWMNKLHDKLGDYAWYRETCQRLLNTLKKRTDKSYGQMLDNPEVHAPQELLSSQGKWSNLKDEQKAVVQLLISQQKLDAGNQLLLAKVQQLLDLFVYEPSLDTPEFMLESFQDAPLASARWLTYSSRQSTFLGRDSEMQLLQEFLHSEPQFSWYCVTGSGGTGKNRLGLEFMLSVPWYWERGLLRRSELEQLNANNWNPAHPTLLVVDYGAEVSDELKDLVDKLIRRQIEFDYPVRLLVLERYYKDQDWWKALNSEGNEALIRLQSFFAHAPLELAPVNNEQQGILQSYLTALGYKEELPLPDSNFWEQIEELSDGGKPLFLGMIAVAINDEGIPHIRGWKREELLNHLLVKEQRYWTLQLSELDKSTQQQIIELMLFTTFVQGVDLKEDGDRFKSAIEASGALADLAQLPTCWKKVQQVTGQTNGVLLPDIFAEYVLAQYWQFEENAFNDAKRQKILTAFLFSPDKTMQVIARCAVDFPTKNFASDWWGYIWQNVAENNGNNNETQDTEVNDYLTNTCFNAGTNIVRQLSLAGCYQSALHNWLKPLSSIDSAKEKAEILNLIGKQYFHLGQFSDALPWLKKCLLIQQDIGDKAGEGTTLNNISAIHHANGDYNTALQYLQQSLKIRQDIGDKAGEGTTLNNISQIYKARGDYNTALQYLQQSLKIQQDIGDKPGEGATLNNISQIYDAKGDYNTALQYLQQSLKIRQDIGDKAGEGTTLNNISQIYDAKGDYNTALQYLQQSLKIRQDIGDKAGEGTTLNNISQIYDAKGDYNTALQYLQQSLKIQQDIGDKPGEGATLNNISQIYDAKGDYNTALQYLQQSLKIRQDIGDKTGEGTTLNNISAIHHANGDYNTALQYLQQSLKIRQDIGDKAGEGTTLNNISAIHHANGDYNTALQYLQQSLKIQQDIGDKAGEGTTLNNISAIHHANGDYNTALQYLQQSLKIQQDIGDKAGEGTTLNNISQIYKARGDYNTALQYLQQSLNIQQGIGDKSGLCATLFNMGHIHVQNNEIPEAMGCWLSVYAMAKPMQLAQALDALENLAPLIGLKDGLDGWKRLYQRSLAEREEQEDSGENLGE